MNNDLILFIESMIQDFDLTIKANNDIINDYRENINDDPEDGNSEWSRLMCQRLHTENDVLKGIIKFLTQKLERAKNS